MRVFTSAGEASGDAYAAAFLRELRACEPDVRGEGIGGPRSRAQGEGPWIDSSRWGVISITQAVRVYFRVKLGLERAKRQMASGPAGLFVPIDFGFFNLRLARYARARGWKVLYFVPPGSWRRDRQGKDLPALTDAIVTPFSWSAEILNKMGANAHFYGHPIRQLIRERARVEVRGNSVAVLPGSRESELRENLPAIAGAVRDLPNPVEFGLAPTVDLAAFQSRWRHLAPGREADRFAVGDTYGVLRRARAGIVCSGTATLEAALCGCPMTIVYRISRLMEFEAKLLRVRPKYIGLPNILLDRLAIPERIQHQATPAQIRTDLDALLADSPERIAQLTAFKELEQLLGPEDAIRQTAELARTLIQPVLS